jgi:hypothetical protein
MGFLKTVKGWFNIGGVAVKVAGVVPQIRIGRNELSGKVILTSSSEKQVLSIKCQVVNEHSYKKDGERRTDTLVLGEQHFPEGFKMKTAETREVPFAVSYDLEEKKRKVGGALGTTTQFGGMTLGSSDAYALVIWCDVKGTPLDPSVRIKLKLL